MRHVNILCGYYYSTRYLQLLLGFESLMSLPITVDFKISKCGIYLPTSSVCARKGYIREHLQAANIFTHLGFGILILHKT